MEPLDSHSDVDSEQGLARESRPRKSGFKRTLDAFKASTPTQVAVIVSLFGLIALTLGLALGLDPRNSTLRAPAKFAYFASTGDFTAWMTRGWNEGFGRVFWWCGWDVWRQTCGGPQIMYALAASDTSTAGGSRSSGAVTNDYSGTNNQIKDVDEGDFVKTDGTYLYQIVETANMSDPNYWWRCERQLVISRVYPTTLAGVVLRHRFDQYFLAREIQIDASSNTLIVLGQRDYSFVDVLIFDMTDKANLVLLRSIRVEGDFVQSRLYQGNLIWIVGFFPGTQYSSGSVVYPTDSWFALGGRQLPNRLVPLFWDSVGTTGAEMRPLVTPEEIGYVTNVYSQQLMSVLGVNVRQRPGANGTSAFEPVGRAVAAVKGSTVMMSPYNLYLATSDYTDGSPNTAIARFEIAGAKIAFRAVGMVQGILLNQFAMDEYQGYLRVATTRYSRGWGPSDNVMWVLNSDLRLTNYVDNIARGERIFSVRFASARAYMVTFRSTDPLYTFSFEANPAVAQLMGELKVPGVSDYLHLASESEQVLIGVGREESAPGRLAGVKISTFNVKQISAPTQIHAYSIMPSISSEYISSDISSDHKVFLYAPAPRNLICVPFSINNYSYPNNQPPFIGALVMNVSADWRLSEKGRISHLDLRYWNAMEYTWAYQESVRVKREIFINEVLYTVSNNVIEGHSIDSLSKKLRMVVGQRNVTIDSSEVYLY